MKPYKMTDAILKAIQKEFKEALKKYDSANIAFQFKYTPKPAANTKKIKVYCLPTAWCKITTLIQKTDTEIAWHMLINKVSKNQYIITDVLVYPQTVTGATVNTDDTKYALWVNAIPDKDFQLMRGQGHSHVNMGVSPSSVDTAYYDDLLKTMQKGFYLFMIANKKGNIFLQLIDVDANVIYETSDIEFEIASQQWHQNKWYDEMIKNISRISNQHNRNSKYAATSPMERDKERYKNYAFDPNEDNSKYTETIGDDWYDRFI